MPNRAPIPLRSRHTRSTASPITATTCRTTPLRTHAALRFANCSKIRAKRKGEPVPRVAVERATRVVVVDRAEEEIALRACDPPSVFAPSRGTRSRRISETLRHSSATKRIDAMTAPLTPFLFSFDRTTSPPSLFLSLRPSIPEDDTSDPNRSFSVIYGSHRVSAARVDGTPVPMGLSGNAVIIARASISRFKFGFVPRVISSCESDRRWWWWRAEYRRER